MEFLGLHAEQGVSGYPKGSMFRPACEDWGDSGHGYYGPKNIKSYQRAAVGNHGGKQGKCRKER